MRRAWLVALALIASCSAPVAVSPSASPVARVSPTPEVMATGGIVEYPIPAPPGCGLECSSGVGTMTLGPDGSIWFVDTGAQVVGRITPAGKVTQFKMPVELAGGAQTITAGPDGMIWVLGRGHASTEPDWVLRLSVDGQVTQFPTLSTGAGTESIAAGPDGNVWFTEFWTGRVARVTPSGVITEFQVPHGDQADLRGIVAGRDGNLWFAESNAHVPAIGRITTKGVATEFPVGGATDSPPLDVIAGPDGDIWFTRALGDSLGRISPNGQTVQAGLPQGSRTVKIVAGPDGNVWFADSGNNAIGRMSVAGAVREFPLPRRGSQPLGMAVAKDGHIWFAEGHRVGSIGVKVPEALFSERVAIFAGAAPQGVTVTNTGDAALRIDSVRVSGVDAALFAMSHDACDGRSLDPGARCTVTVTRSGTDQSGVVRSAYLEFADNGSGSPQRISLVAQLPSCRLPIVVSVANQPAQGVLLDMATGHGLYDPNALFVSTASPARVNTTAQPMLVGTESGYFDRAAGRWLPVSSADWISPDGSRYAYISFDDQPFHRKLHVVDVASGRDRALALPEGFWWGVAFTDQGIYMNQRYEGTGPGLWLVDPDTGSMRQVLTDGAVNAVRGNTAWAGVRNPADTLPQWGIGGGSNEIDSVDLPGGASRTWLYVPGSQMYVVGVHDGMPVIGVNTPTGGRIVVVTSPNHVSPLDLPFTNEEFPSPSGFVSDSMGMWIGTADGVYLWTLRTGGILVSSDPATPAGTCA